MTKHLQHKPQRKKPAKGWTAERRALQVAVARRHQPWRYATGPRTAAGKTLSARNAVKHGFRSHAHLENLRRVRGALALAALNIARLRAWLKAPQSPTANRDESDRTELARVFRPFPNGAVIQQEVSDRDASKVQLDSHSACPLKLVETRSEPSRNGLRVPENRRAIGQVRGPKYTWGKVPAALRSSARRG